MRISAWLLLPLLPLTALSHPCESCHPKEVAGYSQTGMGRSLRAPVAEPDGSFEHLTSATTFLIRSSRSGFFQRMEHGTDKWDYRIAYVIGSGSHASCYLALVGDHLFESPICYYPARGYAMAPGYEDNAAPGYTRPVTLQCLLCHSGRPLPIAGSINRYQSPAFSDEAISCDRCHGDASAHLRRPVPGSIVNPARLAAVRRDSVCEQCHLSGLIRVPNPGKNFADFRPGERLEDVYTTYVGNARGGSFRVVSQSEQLALSQCARMSGGRMWCGTCHDPHSQPVNPAAYFRARCLSCHARAFPAEHPSRTSDCLPCHMPQRDTTDGGHTAFTDHRIQRKPAVQPESARDVKAWREPAPALRARNYALALNYAGLRESRDSLLAESFPLLLSVRKQFPDDPDVLTALGQALMKRKEFAAAAQLFERAIALRPADPTFEDNAGAAWLQTGDKAKAVRHFERALDLDSLLLPDIEALLRIYREQGDRARETALMGRVQKEMITR